MELYNPIFAVAIYFLAFISAKAINYFYKFKTPTSRNISIDGLRGFLAIGVFIHHSSIWYMYIHKGVWEAPKSNLYAHLGAGSVALFFMITSFLFVSKLLNSKNEMNWKGFYISRILRLAPAYYFSLVLILLVVLLLSDWKFYGGFVQFLSSTLHWLFFTVFNNPYINHFGESKFINAGVLWSLRYEWLFYFMLPFLSIPIVKKIPPMYTLVIGVVFMVVYLRYREIDLQHIYSFVGGAIAPFIIKYGRKNYDYDKPVYSIIVLLCFSLALLFSGPDVLVCKVLYAIAFTIIALGNTVFGLLKYNTLIFLGEICYSTYLLHGIVLFVALQVVLGSPVSKRLAVLEFWEIVFLCTPVVVFLSFVSYLYFEKPGMKLAKKLNSKNL